MEIVMNPSSNKYNEIINRKKDLHHNEELNIKGQKIKVLPPTS